MVNFNATLIAQILNFLVLVFVLAKFAYKPVCNIMEERKNKIASDLEAAEKAKTDAEAVKAEYAAKLAEAKQKLKLLLMLPAKLLRLLMTRSWQTPKLNKIRLLQLLKKQSHWNRRKLWTKFVHKLSTCP